MKAPREILFRAKRISDGEWIEGYYLYYKPCILSPLIPSEYRHCMTTLDGITTDIDPTTLSQFTGMYDKNGKRIFENDVLKNDKGLIRYVKWEMSCGSCCTQVIGFGASGIGHTDFINFDYLDEIEVIGNIFDNADLIKENFNE